MTRFQVILVVAVALAALAVAVGQIVAGVFIIAILIVVIVLGVALPQLSLFGRYVCRGNRSHRRVALSFDDGPDAASTPALLDLLREERVAAAFFCIGKLVQAEPELAARIVREGHLIGNHSFNHSNLTNFYGVPRLKIELNQTQSAIHAATGVRPEFFRPPMGLSNPRVFTVARQLGLQVVGWSARGFDTQINQPARVVRRILRQVRPGGIILLHDGNIPADHLVQTVKRVLAGLKADGYEVVRLDRLLE